MPSFFWHFSIAVVAGLGLVTVGSPPPPVQPSSSKNVPNTSQTSLMSQSKQIVGDPKSATILGEADYIIVGAGPAGLVLADKLSENGTKNVILIERGNNSTALHGGKHVPNWLKTINLTVFDVPGLCNHVWIDKYEAQCPDTPTQVACLLGGNSAVGYGMLFRPSDIDWDSCFPDGWKAKDIKEAADRVFERIPHDDMATGSYKQEVYDVIGDALSKAGWTSVVINQDPNSKNRTFGRVPYMNRLGVRGGPLSTYLVSAKARSNFQLITNMKVRRVLRDGATVYGVEVLPAKKENGLKLGTYKLKTGGKVILSAGVFNTPKILFRSGIGPPDQLKIVKSSDMDGPTMISEDKWIDLPVGYNAMDQTPIELAVSHPKVKVRTVPTDEDKEVYLKDRTGLLSKPSPDTPLVMHDQIKSPLDGVTRQITWIVSATSSTLDNETILTLSQTPGTGFKSRGRVTIDGSLNMAAPGPVYTNDKGDAEAIAIGAENLISALKEESNGFKMIRPGNELTVEEYPKSDLPVWTADYWTGTAKLGTDSGTNYEGTKGNVVDLDTRVYGTTNLFVVDASIFPGHFSGPPLGAIMIAAEFAAEKISRLDSPDPTRTDAVKPDLRPIP